MWNSSANSSKAPVDPNWDFVCVVRGVDCSKIPTPKKKFIPLDGSYGTFRGELNEYVVFIDTEVDDPITLDVVYTHELSHYLDYWIDKLHYPYQPDEICDSEGRAYNVSNAWVLYKNYDPTDKDILRYDWIKYYPWCQIQEDEEDGN